MSSYCASIAQNCYLNCCNASGLCPTSYTSCYYYYYTDPVLLSIGAIIGIVVGCLAGVAAIIGITCWLCRRRRMLATGGGGGVTVMMTGAQ